MQADRFDPFYRVLIADHKKRAKILSLKLKFKFIRFHQSNKTQSTELISQILSVRCVCVCVIVLSGAFHHLGVCATLTEI